MVTLKTIQVILLCIACLSLGFAAGYVLKATVMKDKEYDYGNKTV